MFIRELAGICPVPEMRQILISLVLLQQDDNNIEL